MNYFKFEVIKKSKKSRARVCRIHTPHGIIETPNFVPVATNATLKLVDSIMANQLDIQLMFCNTYHLIINPGTEVVSAAGGLHDFMNRQKPIITDSGGFQVFSLAYGSVKDELKSKGTKKQNESVLKISEEGVTFRSYRDGAKIFLTPESSIIAQKNLGADIIIPLDELPPYHFDPTMLRKSLDRTHRWEVRSLHEHLKHPKNQAMYAVVHGGIDKELRKKSCEFLAKQPFDGFAVGGSLGKNKTEMLELLRYTMPLLPEEFPNHLLGIGDLESIAGSIPYGIDTFDSSHPTKCARHGLLFSSAGNIKIEQAKYKTLFEPIDRNCTCFVCHNYTASYIHHLFKANEVIGWTLASVHNLNFMVNLMKNYRELILNDQI